MKLKYTVLATSILLIGVGTAQAEVAKVLIGSPVGSAGQDRAVIRIWNDSNATQPVFVAPQMLRRSTGAAWPALSVPCAESFPDFQGRYAIQPGQYCSYYVQVDGSDDIVGRVEITAPNNASLGFVRGSVEIKNYHTTINRAELY